MDGQIPQLRIWLSGSVPDDATPAERERILAFADAFAREVFRLNGRLVHGCHPMLRGTLLQAAEDYQQQTGDKAGLVCVVSRMFSKDPAQYGIDLPQWNRLCAEQVLETPEAVPDPEAADVRQRSLDILRDTLVEQANVIVAIGGRWWDIARHKAGTPQEIQLAVEHQLPCFLLGGLGGSTARYLDQHPELLRQCRNGLSVDQNRQLAQISDPAVLAAAVVQQLQQLPVRYRDPDSGRPFRILCLDGGGIRGIFTAAVLAHWEQATGRRIVEHFDLIAGTSTGGLLAIGLGLGLPASQLQQFYENEGGEIFPVESELGRVWHGFRHWFSSKFDRQVLQQKLSAAFATGTQNPASLNNSLCRLVIPAYNTEADTLLPFRTPHGPFARTHAGRDPLIVAQATAAAPTYFDPVQTRWVTADVQAVDGGVWANNPGSVALAEAVQHLGIPATRIQMLSVGTTWQPGLLGQPLLLDGRLIGRLVSTTLPVIGIPVGWALRLMIGLLRFVWKPRRVRGTVGWIGNIAGFLMKTQAQTTDYVCEHLLGDRYLRVDSASSAGALDDLQSMKQLTGLADKVAAQTLPAVEARFLNGVPAQKW